MIDVTRLLPELSPACAARTERLWRAAQAAGRHVTLDGWISEATLACLRGCSIKTLRNRRAQGEPIAASRKLLGRVEYWLPDIAQMELDAESRDVPKHPETSRNIPKHPETSRNIPKHPETSRNIPKHPETSSSP